MDKTKKQDNSTPVNTAKLFDSMSHLLAEINPGGWHNKSTGLGVSGKDKRLGAGVSYRNLTEPEVEQLFGADDIAGRVVTEPADLATKNWVKLDVSIEEGGSEMEDDLKDEEERLFLQERVFEAFEWSRLYGGAGIFIAVDDGKDLSEPLDLNSVRKIRNLAVLQRWELHSFEIDYNLESPNFMLPRLYQIGARGAVGSGSKIVHWTRIARFDGPRLPRQLFERNNYWGDSVLTRLYNVLRNFNLSHDSSATIMQDFRQAIIKIKGLADIVASGNADVLRNRIETMNLSKSVLGAVVLDDEESMENLATTLNGVENLLDKINHRLVAATGLPHTMILGEGATGTLGGGGESERKQINSLISGFQQKHIKKPLTQIYRVIMAQRRGPTRGQQLESFSFEFNDVFEPTEMEKAELRNKQADTDSKYIADQVLTPDEVRDSRFGGEEYTIETTIEKDGDDFDPDLEDPTLRDPMESDDVEE